MLHGDMFPDNYSEYPAFTCGRMASLRNAAIGVLLALAKLNVHSD
jgi:hypothetical protein